MRGETAASIELPQLCSVIFAILPRRMAPSVICCGLSCVDMELHSCNIPRTLESVTTFSKATFTAGGSAPQTARALAALSVSASVLTVVGADPHGKMLRDILVSSRLDPSALVVNPSQCTSLAVLPLYADGTRGCFVTLGANLTASASDFLTRSVLERNFTESLRVFHFGYPHLMPNLQGMQLRELFERVRAAAPRVLLTLDVNGADVLETYEKPVLLPALELTAVVHANLEEACVITGLAKPAESTSLSAKEIRPIARWFTERGAGIACITCGKDGVLVGTGGSTRNAEWADWAERLRLSPKLERDAFVYRGAFRVSESVEVNASGAGDAFTAGVISELADCRGENGILRVADAGLASALLRIEPTLSGSEGVRNISELLKRVSARERIPARDSLYPEELATTH